MPELCLGFEAHQPFRLNRQYSPNTLIAEGEVMDLYFDPRNREVLSGIAERCYIPATERILEHLDDGFACAFSFSGTLLEQLEQWNPDVLHLFQQVAQHRNVEVLAQTYYHSLASLFDDKSEFEDQVLMHTNLVHDLLDCRPSIVENTDLIFNNDIAIQVWNMGYRGMYAEGVDRTLGGKSPNHVYSCQGLPILFRNTTLSDDIALRFTDYSWDRYPLTADTYASWIASSPGDVATVFLNYETFGAHIGADTGILDFLSALCGECKKQDVKFLLPSQVIASYLPIDSIDVPETTSWAGSEKDISAWLGNDRQHTAFATIQHARAYAVDKKVWRYLQTSNHLSEMGFGYAESADAFNTYMRILADYEGISLQQMKDPAAAYTLRTLPPEHAFHFASSAGYIGFAAYSLDQFHELLNVVPEDSIRYHQERGDFANWADEILTDSQLAEALRSCAERQDLIGNVLNRKQELWNRIK